MLATIMGFCYLVFEGLRKMGVAMRKDEAEARYYRWRVFAQLMGIHPPGRPDDDSWIPADHDEAALFYASYARRHYTGPDRNPAGVKLTEANLAMMTDLIPRWLRWLGFGALPRIAMSELLSREDLALVGMTPVAGHRLLKGLFTGALYVLYGLRKAIAPQFLWLATHVMLQGIIREGRGGEVEFSIPTSLSQLRGPAFV